MINMIETNEANELTSSQLRAIDTLLSKIESTNTICRSDIMSLESIAVPMGDTYSLNSFTVIPSRVNLEDTVKTLKELKQQSSVAINEAITMVDIKQLALETMCSLTIMRDRLLLINNEIDKQAIISLLEDNNSYFYNIYDKLIDIRTLTIDEMVDEYRSIQHLLKIRGLADIEYPNLSTDKLYYIFSVMELIKNDEYISVYNISNFNYKQFTFSEVMKIVINLDIYCVEFSKLINQLNDIVKYQNNDTTIYKVLSRLNSIISNVDDIVFLNMMLTIFKK